jgi:phosphoribosyl-AMP cyclohydrolase
MCAALSQDQPMYNHDLEDGAALTPKFDASGLVTAVVTDAASGETGEAWYFSRSRQRLWKKGEQSGHVQRVVELRVDCDQDAVWLKVEQAGEGACHTGRRSCFYRAVPLGQSGQDKLQFVEDKVFDPNTVYDT